MKNAELIKRFLPYFKKYRWALVFDLVCAGATTVCELVLPLIVSSITDMAISDAAALTVAYVVRMGVVYLALRGVDAFANFYMSDTGHIMGAKIETDMRRDLFSHLQKLSFSYYNNAKVGQIMARITSDLFEITEFAHHCPEELFITGIKLIASFAILASVNIWLTLIVFALLPFMLWFCAKYHGKMRGAFRRQRSQVGEINSQVEDSLLGVRVVKSFANEDMEERKFEEGNRKFLGIKRESYRYMAMFASGSRVFDGLMYAAVIIAGGIFLQSGSITPGELVAFLLYVATLITSVRRIVEFSEQFQRGMTGVERFCEIMDEPAEITDAPGATELAVTRGEIRFSGVSFRYSDGAENVLSDIDLTVSAGENIALVGPSGGGKTTLCNLIPRFYDVTEGCITIDGQDIKGVTLHSLRSQIGMVQQEVYLFSGTVGENIHYGKPTATQEEVEEAARLAGAHDFIMALPQGYDTYVGERGVKLSGGQKQRISIARVFLKNPPILLLDEATSALDNESEHLVQRSLETLAAGRTTFTIAHRLTTIRRAKLILVLTERGIEEQGDHESLMRRRGIYYKLYTLSNTGSEDDMLQN